MNAHSLIASLQSVARFRADVAGPVSEVDLARVETTLGFRLNDLLRRFYLEVANGQLFDIFSIATATTRPPADSSLLEVRGEVDPTQGAYLGRAVPFVYLDHLAWIWVDQDGALFSAVEEGLYRAPATFEAWLRASLDGSANDLLFSLNEPRLARNPFTGKPHVSQLRSARGELLVAYED